MLISGSSHRTTMKSLLIFLTVPIVAISAALMPQDLVRFGVVRRQCENKYTVDPTMIDRVREGEVINDPTFDCFMACILEGMDLVDANGALKVDTAIRHVPDAPFHDEVVGVIKKCGSQTAENNCDTAHQLFVCFHDNGIMDILQG